MPSKNAESEVARVWLNEKMEFSWVSELLVLGCHLDGSGSTETLVQKRLEQGRKMFGRTRSLLSCPKNSRGRAPQNVLFYGCSLCLVELGVLGSVGKDSAASLFPRKQVASLYAVWSKDPRCCMGGLVSRNETCDSCVEMQVESSVPVARSSSCGAWLGWSCGSERQLTSRSRCNPVTKREMVGDHEKYWSWFKGPQLAASEAKLGTQF